MAKFEKMGLFRHPQWWYLKRLKDPPTWLKVTTALEKDPNSHSQQQSEIAWIVLILVNIIIPTTHF